MKLTGFLVLLALLSSEGAQPEEVSLMRKSADMQITVTRYTVKLTPPCLVCADCTAEEESDKGDKLQALVGVLDSPAAANPGAPLREEFRQTL